MIDVAILEAMAAAGASVEMIIAAVKAAQAKHDEKITQRRAKDAERKRRSRSVRNGHAESRGPSDDVCDPPEHILPPKIQKAKKLSVSARKQPLPDGFQLSVADIDFARSKGWSDNKTADEEQRFINHARATGRRQIDWAAAWRMWVTSPFQNGAKTNGHAKSGTERAFELADEWRRREAAEPGLFGSDDDAGSH